MGSRRGSISSMESGKSSLSRRSSNASENSEISPLHHSRIMDIVSNSASEYSYGRDMLEGTIISCQDLIANGDTNTNSGTVHRRTCLIKIDLSSCGNPPYEPGDHVRVFPRNNCKERLEEFVSHLIGDLSLDDHIYVSFESDEFSLSELKVSLPLVYNNLGSLVPLRDFFEKEVAFCEAISMDACKDLSKLATSTKDQTLLNDFGTNKNEHEKMCVFGMKWIDLFVLFPSLSKQVTIGFLACNMKKNHARSYSISSCKAIVGQEMHLVVGRFIYSRGGNKKEAGLCSDFLTSIMPNDEVSFQLESAPSFHLPVNPDAKLIFICTGTGFAPIRGLLQKRAHFQSRGQKLGPGVLVFGSRSSKEGLFHDEIQQFRGAGVLTDVFFCYSREPGQRREYTTDKMRSQDVIDVLRPLLVEKENTHVFICGSANMAEKCKAVMKEISSPSCIDAIVSDQRLHCDVFGAVSPRSRAMRHHSAMLSKECKEGNFDSVGPNTMRRRMSWNLNS